MICQTDTEPAITYESYMTGPQGERIILYPVRCKHSALDVKKATDWAHAQLDVVKLEVQWKSPREEVPYPLMKLPDHVIIRNQQMELGKAASYIQELEEQTKPKHASPEERAEAKKSEIYQKQQEKIQELNQTVQRLKKDNDNLIIKIAKLQQNKSGI